MKGICPVCDDWVTEPGRDVHEDCEMARFMIAEPVGLLSQGNIEPWLAEFVPEVNFVFVEDWRTRKIFKVAEDVLTRATFFHFGADFPLSELELKGSPEQVRQIFEVLSLARLASLEGDSVRLGALGRDICGLLPSGEPWDSPAVRRALEQIYGWICIIISSTFMQEWARGNRRIGRPRKILKVFQWLGNVALDYPDQIPTKIEADQLFYERYDRFKLSERDRLQIAKALIGFKGRDPKVFERHYGSPGGMLYFVLKPQTCVFLERIRERYRERERERGR